MAASVLHPSPDSDVASAALSPGSPRDASPSSTVLVVDVGGSWDVLRTLQILRGRALEERSAGQESALLPPGGAGSRSRDAPFDADAAAAERVRRLAVCVARSTAEVVGALATACDWIEEGWGEEDGGLEGQSDRGVDGGNWGDGRGSVPTPSPPVADPPRAGAGSQTASSSSPPPEPRCPPPPCLVLIDDLFSYAPVDAAVRGAPSGAGDGDLGGRGSGPAAWGPGAGGAGGAPGRGGAPFSCVVPVHLDLHSLTSTIATLIERILATKKAAVVVGRRTPDAPRRRAERGGAGGASGHHVGAQGLISHSPWGGGAGDASGASGVFSSALSPASDVEPALSTPPPFLPSAPSSSALPAPEAGPPGVGPPPLSYRRLEPRSLRLAFDPRRLDVRAATWDGNGGERGNLFVADCRIREA